MEQTATAILRYTRIAPRKVRFVADMIRGLSVKEAEAQLMFSPRRPSDSLLKLLRSATANAKEKKMDIDRLFVKSISVDEGPTLKRWRPRARGAINPIHKKMSHVTLILGEGSVADVAFRIPEKPKKKKEEKKKASEKGSEKHRPEMETEKSKGKEKGDLKKFFRRKSV